MTFAPVAPWPVIVGVVVLALVGCVVLAVRTRRRLAWSRRAAIVVLLTVVALRPGTDRADADVVVSDLDVFFLVDRTGSMAAEDDPAGTRLDAVVADVLALAEATPGARWTLIGFDDDVTALVPLITDTTAFHDAVVRLRPEVLTYSNGSSPRLPVAELTDRLAATAEQEPDRRRVLFVFTDGETTVDEPLTDSFGPVRELIEGGAVLGYGSDEGGRMRVWTAAGPTEEYIVDSATGAEAVSRIDRGELDAIAGELGVPMVDRTGGDPLAAATDGMAPAGRATTAGRLPVHQDLGWWWAYPLLGLVLWEAAAVTAEIARVVPERRTRAMVRP